MSSLKKFIVTSLLFSVSFSVFANNQTIPDLTKIDFENLLQMDVATASSIARQLSDSPSAVTIVTADDISAFGYQTLAEILDSMRGLYTSYDRAYAYPGGRGYGRPGDFTGRIQLLIDGFPVNDNMYDSYGIEHTGLIDTALIERVEYVSGPGTSINSNNAFYGIINVITKQGYDFNALQLSGNVASYSTKGGRATYGKQFDNGVDVLLSASGLSSDGQNLFFPDTVDPMNNIDGIARNLDGQHNQRVFGKVTWTNGELQAAYVNRYKDIPTAPYEADFNAPYFYEDTSFNFGIKQHFDLNEHLKMSLKSSYGYTLYKGLQTYSGDPWKEHTRGQWFTLNSEFYSSAIDGHNIIFGAEYRRDFEQELVNPEQNERHTDQTFSIYLQDEFALSSALSLNAGARYDYTTDLDLGKLSPRLALLYDINNHSQLKLSFSRAYRTPNPYEKFYTDNAFLLANPNLSPEKIDAVELVWQHTINRDASIQASLYQYKTDDFISSIAVAADTTQFHNIAGNTARGAEIEFERHWANKLKLRSSYAYQHALDNQDNWAINAPKHIAKLNLSYPIFKQNWRLAYELQAYSERKTEHDTKIGGYSISNLTLTSAQQFKDLTVRVGIRNLFDHNYDHVAPLDNYYQQTIPQDDRNYYLQLEYNFR